MLTPSSIDHQKKIFILFLHQVSFASKLFEGSGVVYQVMDQRRIFLDFIQVKLLFLVQPVKLGL